MQFSVVNQPKNGAATLFVCTEANQLNNENAKIVFQSLGEKDSFASANLIVAGSLHNIAVLRFADLKTETLQKGAKEVAAWLVKQENVSVDLNPFCEVDSPRTTEALVAAIGEAAYRFDYYKKEANPAKLQNVELVHAKHEKQVQAALAQAQALLYGVNLCKDLGNTGSNICTPTYLAETAAKEAQALGAEAKILDKDYIQANMPSFWGVAKGSAQEPKLLELRYFGAADKSIDPIVLVGKGLTFDSGGISLKPGEGMDEMKYDMCGAATVIGTFIAAVKAKLPINLAVVVATCENMPDAGASKPGDVVKAMNGTTIENLNTDAEGRLVLCDALTYVEQNFKAKAVIDVATLTGACIIALGHVASGLMSNNQDLADELLAASRDCNDKAWQLPLFTEYKEQLKSNFADMQNIGGRPAGTITAATFLAHFAENLNWAHLDIAGTAWKSGAAKGATGRPIPLLFQYLTNQAK
ncbi:leucyl aminopeptidase [Kingella kingae]|uniref:leucyl aminopeptidase n=1 Tax=Kingella kingae TaxID=504 RepID=UPI0004056C07|nr:leucyl aminopeptidase [Kingella kingae]MDK4536544.1 leucyl aminopeptidase [Kingella kingae]MDK4538097.1 leucyl aminopeptidase [Kingella kingae]MDK4547071.1 leucyl aminopeptidase [Kingella kingae]MDK4563997.1 leucyl aminopeptidase [Kingella kingae]MDK4607986.1 leucyl aminopeptidase [Kingella kingae]